MDFRSDHLPFERVMSDFRKNILPTDFERKNSARKYLGRKISCTEKKTYRSWHITLKKNLAPLYVGEKNSSSRGLGKKFLP